MLTKTKLTTQEVAARFYELAQQEKWFETQDEFFAYVKSINPENSPYFGYAEGKEAVRKKGKDFVSRIEAGFRTLTSEPIVTGNYFAVAREIDITVRPHERIQIKKIKL